MAYASTSGRARTSARNPQAHAICDACGFRYNHVDLRWQYDWAGTGLINKRMLVCRQCQDVPQQQLRAIVIAADPLPIQNPRVQDFVTASSDYRATEGYTTDLWTGIPVPDNDRIVTSSGTNRTTQATGAPHGTLNNQPGTDPNAPGNDDPGLPYGYTEVPTLE